jgi:acetolactate synthase-1/2/3 large subunit
LEQHKDLLTDNKPALIEVEFENCPMLPNIHGGLNPYTNGPKLPDVVVAKVKQIMNI